MAADLRPRIQPREQYRITQDHVIRWACSGFSGREHGRSFGPYRAEAAALYRVLRMASALVSPKVPGGSMASDVTTPSFATSAKR